MSFTRATVAACQTANGTRLMVRSTYRGVILSATGSEADTATGVQDTSSARAHLIVTGGEMESNKELVQRVWVRGDVITPADEEGAVEGVWEIVGVPGAPDKWFSHVEDAWQVAATITVGHQIAVTDLQADITMCEEYIEKFKQVLNSPYSGLNATQVMMDMQKFRRIVQLLQRDMAKLRVGMREAQ